MSEMKTGDRVEITFGRREGVQGTVLEKVSNKRGRYRIELDGDGLGSAQVVIYPISKLKVLHRRQSRAPSVHDGALFSSSDFDLMSESSKNFSSSGRNGRAPSGFSEELQVEELEVKSDTSSTEDETFELLEQIVIARDSNGSLGIDVDRNLKIRRIKNRNAEAAGLKVGYIVRKAHGIAVRTPRELVEVVSKSMSHVAVLMVKAFEDKKAPRKPIGLKPSPPFESRKPSEVISPRTPMQVNDNTKNKTTTGRVRKMSIRPRPPPRPPAKQSQKDVLSSKPVLSGELNGISSEPSAMLGGVTAEPTTPLPFTKDSKIALLQARASDLKKKYKQAKKQYYELKTPQAKENAVNTKTAWLKAQESLDDAMKVMKAQENAKSKPSDPLPAPKKKTPRQTPTTTAQESSSQAKKNVSAGNVLKGVPVRKVLIEGTLQKKSNKKIFGGWKEVHVKVDTEGISYERRSGGLFGSSGRIHRVAYSDIQAVGSPEGAERDPKLGKQIEVVFYHKNKAPWLFEAKTLDDAMTFSAKIYYARRQSKQRRTTQATDVAKSLADTMAVYQDLKSGDMIDLGIVRKRNNRFLDWRLKRLLCQPDLGLFMYQMPDEPLGALDGEKWFVKNASAEPVKGTLMGYVKYSIQIIGARSDEKDSGGLYKTAPLLIVKCDEIQQYAVILHLLKLSGVECSARLTSVDAATERVSARCIRLMLKQRKRLQIEQIPEKKIWNSEESANVLRYVNYLVDTQKDKLRRTSSSSVVSMIQGFKRHSTTSTMMKNKEKIKSVCLGYGVVRSSDGAFDSTTNGRRRRITLELSRKGNLVLRTDTVGALHSSCIGFMCEGARVEVKDLFDNEIEVKTTMAWPDSRSVKSSVSNVMSIHITLTGCVEQLLLFLKHISGKPINMSLAIFNPRTKFILDTLNMLKETTEKSGAETIHKLLMNYSGNVGGKTRGGWVKLSSVLDSTTIRSYRTKIDMEFKSSSFQEKYLRNAIFSACEGGRKNSSGDFAKMSQRLAVFVLGPSASGKTFMTKKKMSDVLKSNGLHSNLQFVSIDGGLMREESDTWNEMKALTRGQYDGFSDLFSEYFQSEIGEFKKTIFKSLSSRGVNVVIPETATRSGKVSKMMDALNDNGYTIIMTVVHASKAQTGIAGRKREISEGKRYNSMSWMLAMYNVQGLFEYARDLGFNQEVFFSIDNTDHSESKIVCVPPYHSIYFSWKSVDGSSRGYAEVSSFDDVPFHKLQLMLPNTMVEMRLFYRKDNSKWKGQKWMKKCISLRGTREFFVWMLINEGKGRRRDSVTDDEYEIFEFGAKEIPNEPAFIDLTGGDCEVYKLEEKTEDKEEKFVTVQTNEFVFTDNLDRADDKTLVFSSSNDKNTKIEICYTSKEDREVWYNSLQAAVGYSFK